jgi:hypothetical protein
MKVHLGKHVNIAAIATSNSNQPRRTKARQFAISFNIVDHSTGASPVEVDVYRAHKASLPVVRAGDGVLLREFEIVALSGRGFGLCSQDDSGYVVWPAGSGEEEPEPQINGPPVEDIDGEAEYVALMKKWYTTLDQGALQAANETLSKGEVDDGAKK